MSQNKIITQHFQEHSDTIDRVFTEHNSAILAIAKRVANVIDQGGSLLWCGNGGSAADCQHLNAELVGRFKKHRHALRSVSLTADTSVLTSIANDYSYEEIFSRQIEAIGRPEDLLIGISTSGNSENLLKAFKVAKNLGIATIALLGKDGGKAKTLADLALVINSNSTARIQEAHLLIGHILCDLVEQNLDIV